MASSEKVCETGARSVAHKPLPPPTTTDGITQILFYQYVEPVWSARRQKQALAEFHRLAAEHGVTGRGRIALEGVNCTLTTSAWGARRFCQGLRDFDPNLFNDTDFKLTDGVDPATKFKALTIKSTLELVAYGLGGERAPLLKQNTAKHLEADAYHAMLGDANTVVIDVRNFYETDIGRMEPPPGGAEFLDPKMRNSREFPKWLNQPETKEKLKGKKVMMYCTGGIRCERATALLSQMERAEEDLQTDGIYHVRGGIDRYLKTFPQGGYWKGRNYLFDLRGEQSAEEKDVKIVETETKSHCCVCKGAFALYKGKHACSDSECKVPVIVCDGCRRRADGELKASLKCPLCEQGVTLRDLPLPDWVGQKRKLALDGNRERSNGTANGKPRREMDKSRWVHVARLPLCVTSNDVKLALAGIEVGKGAPSSVSAELGGSTVEWIADQKTNFFYGSCYVEFANEQDAVSCVERCATAPARVGKKNLKVNYAPARAKDSTKAGQAGERPPVPITPGA
jgi:predicted sulfurtransferase